MDCTKEHITREQQVLSICYGYGGLERGVGSVIPIRTVAYVEIEAFQVFNLVAAMEAGLVDKAPVWTDIKTFNAKPFRNRIHGIIGGYPCQGESFAGKRKLWNDPRFLWPYIERAVIASRPLWCFFENVSGHLTGSFPYILDSLRNLGYSVESGLFTASEIGAPHKRERLFILAMVDANSLGNRTQFGKVSKKDGEISQQYENAESVKSSKEVGNTKSSNKQRYLIKTESGKRKVRRSGKMANSNGINWPNGPGRQQNEWEESRTIESGVGCTINGYNFRTELLRQYGNGVVSQTAEKAFEMLLDKHINNIRKV